jgi:hypothetical protein
MPPHLLRHPLNAAVKGLKVALTPHYNATRKENQLIKSSPPGSTVKLLLFLMCQRFDCAVVFGVFSSNIERLRSLWSRETQASIDF